MEVFIIHIQIHIRFIDIALPSMPQWCR